jgi:hypothetical protein
VSLADKAADVARLERDCLQQRQAARDALQHLRAEVRRSATPMRLSLIHI